VCVHDLIRGPERRQLVVALQDGMDGVGSPCPLASADPLEDVQPLVDVIDQMHACNQHQSVGHISTQRVKASGGGQVRTHRCAW
jgi:hypothetical protein